MYFMLLLVYGNVNIGLNGMGDSSVMYNKAAVGE